MKNDFFLFFLKGRGDKLAYMQDYIPASASLIALKHLE